jgi:hypothetical protein
MLLVLCQQQCAASAACNCVCFATYTLSDVQYSSFSGQDAVAGVTNTRQNSSKAHSSAPESAASLQVPCSLELLGTGVVLM